MMRKVTRAHSSND